MTAKLRFGRRSFAFDILKQENPCGFKVDRPNGSRGPYFDLDIPFVLMHRFLQENHKTEGPSCGRGPFVVLRLRQNCGKLSEKTSEEVRHDTGLLRR